MSKSTRLSGWRILASIPALMTFEAPGDPVEPAVYLLGSGGPLTPDSVLLTTSLYRVLELAQSLSSMGPSGWGWLPAPSGPRAVSRA